MNYIYYNEFGKEIKKYLSPIAKGSSGIKIYIFSDFDNSSATEYEVSASFKKADGFVAGDIFLPLSSNTKINPYNQQAMYYRELTIGNDVTDIVGGLELSIRYITINVITIDPDAEPPVTYNEEIIKVTGMVTFNIYNAVNFITPPQNTQLINLKNYVDNKDALAVIDNDNKLFLKADKIDTYLKTEVYNKDESYNQTEIDNLNDLNAKLSTTYTILETDELLDNKANIVILQSITTVPETAEENQIYYNAYDKKIYLYDGTDWGVDNVGANGILYLFSEVLYVYNTYDGLIKIGQKPAGFNALYVDSLSSNANDFNDLTVENQIIANSGIDNKSNKIINVLAGVDNNDAVNVKQLADVIAGDLSEHYKKVETYSRDEIIDLIASNYKAKGNLAPAGLVAGLLVKANLGNVYNITGQFTTTINFLEGAGIIHEAGENVVIVEYTTGVYKFDVLSGFVDLSEYVEKEGSKVLSDNNFTTTLKDKLTGIEANAEVNVQSDWNQTINTEDDFIKNKPIIPDISNKVDKDGTKGLSDENFTTVLKAKLDNAEITSNKVFAWSETTNDTRYPSEKLVKDSLDAINVGLENIGSLSPLRFAGYFTGGTVSNDFNNLIRPFENLTEALPDFYINNIKGAMFVCNAASDFVFNTVYTWVDGVKTTPITFNWAAPYDEGLGTVNFEVGDTISILNFAYDTVENEMFILIKVEKSSGVKADKVIPASTGNIPKLNATGNLEDSTFKLEKSVPANAVFTDTVPTDYVVKNETITGSTKTKITYDAKGLVTAGADLLEADIPTLAQSKITNLSTDLENKADKRPAQKTITTATTLALTDEGKVILANGTLKVTIPLNSSVSFPIDTEIAIVRYGTGEVTIGTASGATLNGKTYTTTFKISAQYNSIAIKKIGTDTWIMSGAFEEVV